MIDTQADYELMREQEAQPLESGDDDSITLNCGDSDAEVFYSEDGSVTVACIGGVNLERHCFSAWQIQDWEQSISRHLKALADEAWAERFEQ